MIGANPEAQRAGVPRASIFLVVTTGPFPVGAALSCFLSWYQSCTWWIWGWAGEEMMLNLL